MTNEEQIRLRELTTELLALNEEAQLFYLNEARKEGYQPDFYGRVRPFANRVKSVSEQWLPLATSYVQHEKPLHLHPIQITQTVDNLEVVAIKSFYGQTSKRRQIETFKSVDYVLRQILE